MIPNIRLTAVFFLVFLFAPPPLFPAEETSPPPASPLRPKIERLKNEIIRKQEWLSPVQGPSAPMHFDLSSMKEKDLLRIYRALTTLDETLDRSLSTYRDFFTEEERRTAYDRNREGRFAVSPGLEPSDIGAITRLVESQPVLYPRILSILEIDNGLVLLNTGKVDRGEGGRGMWIFLKKIDGAWSIESVKHWIS
jgi:hypothetical protein